MARFDVVVAWCGVVRCDVIWCLARCGIAPSRTKHRQHRRHQGKHSHFVASWLAGMSPKSRKQPQNGNRGGNSSATGRVPSLPYTEALKAALGPHVDHEWGLYIHRYKSHAAKPTRVSMHLVGSSLANILSTRRLLGFCFAKLGCLAYTNHHRSSTQN